MAMRQVGFEADSVSSSKMTRLEEIVEEATDSRRKVVVFSYFLDTLNSAANALGSRVVGTISGSVSAAERQRLVDRFTEATGGAVLLSQILAGGVGINLQAASVVILCEPQVKPTLESQAVKRVHRMGQVRTVQVHRLLSEDSIDGRLLRNLAAKSEIFEQYAAQSEVAAASPEAVDTTESALVKRVLAEEQERYAEEIRARLESRPARPVSSTDAHASRRPAAPVSQPETTPETASTPASEVRPSRAPESNRRWRSTAALTPPDRDFEPLIQRCAACERPIKDGHCGCS